MAMTKLETFRLYMQRASADLLSQRIEQMYNLLSAAEKTAVWPVIQSDLTTILNGDKTAVEADITASETQVAAIDAQIADIAASVP